ncbi:MAG: hypothetical protein ACYDHW_02685 [Syntrophorhabdaceae bacterium]
MRKIFRFSELIRICSVMLFMFTICGCIQDNVVIKLNPDGSGTIVETIMSNMFKDMMQKECGKDCPSEDDIAAELAKETMRLAKDNAGEFGKNVRLVSVKPARTNKAAGSTAVYSFDDINKISINKDPLTRTSGYFRDRGRDDNNINFSFKKGTPAQLKITMFPEEWLNRQMGPDKEDPEDKDDFENMDAETKELIRSGRVQVAIEINGDILKSNASYQADKKITLIDVSFENVPENDSMLNKLQKKPPRSIKEYKEAIKGAKDFKLELTCPVIIEFQQKPDSLSKS